MHAFLGCDTTSRLYGVGKGSILKKFKENVELQKAAVVFDGPNSTQAQVQEAGEKAFVAIYGGKKSDNLNSLRFKKYSEKVATSLSSVDSKSLPPTSAAAKFHSYRVFLQVNQWKDLDCSMDPALWGWTATDNGLRPVSTDIDPAPEALLKVIRCNCITDCSSARCSCQKHGMKCSIACGHCRGSACQNSTAYLEDEDEETEHEDSIDAI